MGKVRVVEYAERWGAGGVESYILNMLKGLNHDKFDLRIVVAQKESELYDKELEKYGVQVESILPQICNNPIKRVLSNQRAFENYFSEHPCDALHLHICQGVVLRYAKLAKHVGIKKVISHCHNAEIGKGNRAIKLMGHWLGKAMYRKYVDSMIACSDLAASWLYTSSDKKSGKVSIMKPIVDVDNFVFSIIDRIEMRKKYVIADDTVVYLSIGRLHYQKNQMFLLDVFEEIHKIDVNSILFLIGTGEMKEKIHKYAKRKDAYQKIIFIDETREISKYMSMSDVFLLTSLFEGNPVVGAEAQASGLPCFFADTITKQAKVLESTKYISLKRTADEWARQIASDVKKYSGISRDTNQMMKAEGYDVEKQIAEIEKMYFN